MALELITAPNLRNIEGLVHAFTTRRGGVSHGPFESLNLGYSTGDDDDLIDQNHELLCGGLGIDSSKLVTSRLVHGKECILVDHQTNLEELSVASADILMTREPGLFLMIKVADCYPITVVDTRQKILANIHAGWRGTLEGIFPYALELMKEKLNSKFADLQIAIGPGISKQHFEVSLGIASLFKDKLNLKPNEISETDVSAHLDLCAINLRQAVESGMNPQHIWLANACTFQDEKRFFSYRRDGKNSGRFAGVVGWKI